jgi:AraC-like DNA-binding protein
VTRGEDAGSRDPRARGPREDPVDAPAIREVIPRDPGTSFRWRVHGYPDPLARWNRHPEYELHLIRRGTGRYIIGDVIGRFGPGDLFLVGPELPHDWISDLGPDERIDDRDVVLQFDPAWLAAVAGHVPEFAEIAALFTRAGHGILFRSETGRRGAELLERVGRRPGLGAVAEFLMLLDLLGRAPAGDQQVLSSRLGDLELAPDTADLVAPALDYIFANIDGRPRLSVAAALAGMSESAFSRYFKSAGGQTFSGMVKRLRLTQACRLLEQTDTPIARIAQSVGYTNLSNFNRRFRDEYGMTPSEFRRTRTALARQALL